MARALMSILQVARAPDGEYEIQARLLVENYTDQPLVIDTGGMKMVSGDLVSFLTPRATPRANPQVAARTSVTIDLAFRFPSNVDPERVDYSTLNVRWQLQADSGDTPISMNFNGRRVFYYYPTVVEYGFYDPWVCY